MNKYIDADEYKKKLRKRYKAGIIGRKVLICEFKAINEMSPADVRENVHGEWIDLENNDLSVCSQCNKYYIDCGDKYEYNFCPRCGVDMRRTNSTGRDD